MFTLALASLTACLAGWLLWRAIVHRRVYDVHRIPGPRSWPVVGNLPDILGAQGLHLHKTLADWAQLYGGVYKWQLGPQTMLVVSDPAETAKLCANPDRQANLDKWHPFYSAVETRAPHFSLIGDPNFEQWRHSRKIMNPAFSPENIRKAFPQVLGHVHMAVDVLDILRQQGPVDIKDFSSRLTADVIHSVAFDNQLYALDLRKLPNGDFGFNEIPYLQLARDTLEMSVKVFTNPFYSLCMALCPWMEDAKRLKGWIKTNEKEDDRMAQLIRDRGVQPTSNTSVWACLGRLTDHKTGALVTPEVLAINTALVFLAGYETTAFALTWALFELAAHPHLQAQVHEELQAAGYMPTPDQPESREMSHADVGKLPILESVLKETLRLHPTAPLGTFRQAKQDMVVGGYRIPKGTPINLPVYVGHTAAHNFEQPYRFWPQRWQQTGHVSQTDKGMGKPTPIGNSSNLSHSFNPFFCGPRNCIGQSLAMLELRTSLIILLSRFQFALPPEMDPAKLVAEDEVWMLTLAPRHSLRLVVTPVQSM